jgi:hypothetical protein
MANIGANEFCLCAKRAEFSDQLGARIAVATRDDDLIAFLAKARAVARPIPVSAPVIKTPVMRVSSHASG